MSHDIDMTPVKAFIEGSLLGGRTITADENLLLSGLIDSLGVMSLIAFIEKEFSLQIPFEDVLLENFMSLDAMAAYLAGRQSADV